MVYRYTESHQEDMMTADINSPLTSVTSMDCAPFEVGNDKPALVRFVLASGQAILIIGAGALVWAVSGYALQRMFLFVPIVIGMGIAVAYRRQFRELVGGKAALLFAACLLSTLASILSGEFGLTVFLVSREFEISALRALLAVVLHLDVFLLAQDTLVGLVFGVIGAIFGFRSARSRR